MSQSKGGISRLRDVVATLRGPDGCPWDREQTLQSMAGYLVEETYEVLDAIGSNDPIALREELGDLLFNVCLTAQIAADQGMFTLDDAADAVSQKLVRRHPHVFGDEVFDEDIDIAGTIHRRWDEIKRAERPERRFFDGIPQALPALLRARRITDRAARIGFEWPNIEGVWAKIREEDQELQQAIANNEPNEMQHEYGDVLFAWVNLGRFLGIDPEDALQATNRRFMSRFSYVEAAITSTGRTLEESTLEEMDALWNEAKQKSKQKR